MSIYERGLQRRDANHVALSPIDFLVRASEVYGGLPAVVYGRVKRTWGETFERRVRLASALASLGIKRGDTVAVMLPNIPAIVETHFGVPMAGAVLNALNTRLEVASILYMIEHGEAKVSIVDTEFAAIADRVRECFPEIKIICVQDFESDIDHGAMPNDIEYECFIASGDSNFEYLLPFPDGYVKLKDRSKDIIISGGENISSIEVEDAIHSHPAVAVVAVVAQPDAKWGEVPCAFVELRPGQQVSESDITAHCKPVLAGLNVPKAVKFCELPKTSTGKIQKFAHRQQIGSAAAISQSQS
ncbi:acyl-CoA synthetase (AMP-forming)/AMP-acid ligase II [Paraburkholderia sp. JPY158]|uniref:Acyl-CoA synthetase (AMP-forming)/AMP-acid ligase II n=1 Tax=Paraburkholderia atlantica TaxID=2654982 RepID=A0A7W8Q1X1_PARAM|nr:AMP-binding protein [Paraburkholderia atlantica]MBB5422191.1 acyl-CoA synthetase (AMP-forming)/AMP-acid ligase II [Paraburkholderia atlantica]